MNNDYLEIGTTVIRKSDIIEIEKATIKVPILGSGYDVRGMECSFLHGYSDTDKKKYGIKTQNESFLFPGEDYKIYDVLLIISHYRTYCVGNEKFFVDDVSVALDFINNMDYDSINNCWYTEFKANDKDYSYESDMINFNEYRDMCKKVSEKLYAYNSSVSIIKSGKKIQDILSEFNT